MSLVQRLQEILNAARVSDDEIRGGIKLSEQGLTKVAARLGVTSADAKLLLSQLTAKLHDEHNADVTAVYESADTAHYVYECDFVGNLTIRDTESGDEHFVSGSDSAHLVKALKEVEQGSQAEQALLLRIVAMSGDTQRLEEEETTSDFVAELKNDAGSFNFPWQAQGQHGTGTAAYRANPKEFKLQVVSIRDDRGEEMEAAEPFRQEITKQAHAFIGQE
jgi:hypothetical protein